MTHAEIEFKGKRYAIHDRGVRTPEQKSSDLRAGVRYQRFLVCSVYEKMVDGRPRRILRELKGGGYYSVRDKVIGAYLRDCHQPSTEVQNNDL